MKSSFVITAVNCSPNSEYICTNAFFLKKIRFFLKLFIWTRGKQIRQPCWKLLAKNWYSFNHYCEANLKILQNFLWMFPLDCSVHNPAKIILPEIEIHIGNCGFCKKKCFFSNWSSRHIDCRFDNPTKNLLPKIRKKSKTYQKREILPKNWVRTQEKQLCYNCRQLFTKSPNIFVQLIFLKNRFFPQIVHLDKWKVVSTTLPKIAL